MSVQREREARLAAQLRANLRKRKEQARAVPGPSLPPPAELVGGPVLDPTDDPVTR